MSYGGMLDELGLHRDQARRILEHPHRGAKRLQAINRWRERGREGGRGRGRGREGKWEGDRVWGLERIRMGGGEENSVKLLRVRTSGRQGLGPTARWAPAVDAWLSGIWRNKERKKERAQVHHSTGLLLSLPGPLAAAAMLPAHQPINCGLTSPSGPLLLLRPNQFQFNSFQLCRLHSYIHTRTWGCNVVVLLHSSGAQSDCFWLYVSCQTGVKVCAAPKDQECCYRLLSYIFLPLFVFFPSSKTLQSFIWRWCRNGALLRSSSINFMIFEVGIFHIKVMSRFCQLLVRSKKDWGCYHRLLSCSLPLFISRPSKTLWMLVRRWCHTSFLCC